MATLYVSGASISGRGFLEAQQRGSVFVLDPPENGPIGNESAKCRERLAGDTFPVLGASALSIMAGAIATPGQFPAMPLQESAGKLGITGDSIQAGIRSKISVDVGVIS